MAAVAAFVIWWCMSPDLATPGSPEGSPLDSSRIAVVERAHVSVGASTAQETPETTPPAGASETDGLLAQVRDVWDDRVVPGVSIRVRADADGVPSRRGERAQQTLVSDMAGRVRVPRGLAVHLVEPGTSGWTLVDVERERGGSAVIWVHATIEVWGRIQADSLPSRPGADGLEDFAVHAVANVEDSFPGFSTTVQAPGRSQQWLRQHRLDRFNGVARSTPQGSFRAQLPRVGGLLVFARSAGESGGLRGCASAQVTASMYASLRADLELEFLPAHTVSGQLTDREGVPVVAAAVRLYVVQRMPSESVKPSNLRRFGIPYCAVGDPETGEAVVDFQIEVASDAEGRFVIEMPVEGEAHVLVRPTSAHEQATVTIGLLTDDLSCGRIVLDRSDTTKFVRVTDTNGVAMGPTELTFHDSTDAVVQHAVTLSIPVGGLVAARHLPTGHRFVVQTRDEDGRPVLPIYDSEWVGEDELRLTPRAGLTSRSGDD